MNPRFSLLRYLISLWIISVLAIPLPLLANPKGGQVKGGSVTFKQKGNKLTIRQNSDRAVIEWSDFSIAKGESTRFIQPSKSSSALNRVNTGTRSLIDGKLRANGQVILINPAGISVGPSGAINVNSFIGSTLDVSDAEFTAGKSLTFSGNSEESVVNLGKVHAAGGDAVLIGRKVENRGSIQAPGGTAALAAGSEVLIDPDGEDLIKIKPAAGKFGEASHTGQIEAAAVEIKAAGNPYATAINLDGIVIARGAKPQAKVKVDAGAGKARLGSTTVVKASSSLAPVVKVLGGTVELASSVRIIAPGGFVETSGSHVAVADGVEVDTQAADGSFGSWLIDPTDFRVIAGNGSQTNSSIGAATLEASLATTNVQIATVAAGSEAGDIYINAPVTWSAATKLTLTAHRNIYLNQSITSTNAAGSLALEYGQGALAAGNTSDYFVAAPVNLRAGPNFSTKLGSDGATLNYTVITSLGAAGSATAADLQGMNGDVSGRYALGADIDATVTSGWNGGEGFAPIGAVATPFTGTLAGLGHSIDRLTINRPAMDFQGLLGRVIGATARDLALTNVSVSGQSRVGGLGGGMSVGTVKNITVAGSVTGVGETIGGLLGEISDSSVDRASSSAAVTVNLTAVADSEFAGVGGLIGRSEDTAIRNASTSGSVTVNLDDAGYVLTYNAIGGLLGISSGSVSDSSSSASVTVNMITSGRLEAHEIGGLVGRSYGPISDSYTSGDVVVTANDPFAESINVGGLVGYLENDGVTTNGSISGSYATGDVVNGSVNTGGLVGRASGASIVNSYATGAVSGANRTGGLLGDAASVIISNSYATGQVTGVNSTGGLLGFGSVTISNSYATGNVTGNLSSGGLVGFSNTGSSVTDSYATGNVAGSSSAGGLFGTTRGIVSRSYATGNVTGSVYGAGGLAGENGTGSQITECFATGNVTGVRVVGGLVGLNFGGASVTRSYATGTVNASDFFAGGLIGAINSGSVSDSYATGSVSGVVAVGGLVGQIDSGPGTVTNSYARSSVSSTGAFRGSLVGYNGGTIISSFWDSSIASGVGIAGGSGAGARGLSTAQFQDTEGFMARATGWDFNGTWAPSSEGYYPELYALSRVVWVDTADSSRIYGNANPNFSRTMHGGPSSYVFGPAGDSIAVPRVGRDLTRTTPAGIQAITGRESLTSRLGESYRAVYTGDLTIRPRAITVTADAGQSKIYGDADPELSYTVGGLGLVRGDTLTGSLRREAGQTVGSYEIRQGSLSGGGNYAITFRDNSFEIDPAALLIRVNDALRYQGKPNPRFTVIGEGFRRGDQLGDLTGTLGFSGPGTETKPDSVPGVYPVFAGGLDSQNYSITWKPGMLTVDPPLVSIQLGIEANQEAQPSAESILVSSPEGVEIKEMSNMELYRMFIEEL